ncbi:ankyrin, partial [Aspergillus ellipticus CBS 707.79]
LLDNSADIFAKTTDDGLTALHLASQFGNREIVKLLLNSGACIDSKTRFGWTLLHSAAFKNRHGVVLLLLQFSQHIINVRAENRGTSLHLAAQVGHKRIVQLLVEKGADVRAKTKYGDTPAHLASWYSHSKAIGELLALGMNYDWDTTNDQDGCTALHYAAKWGVESIARMLVSDG